LQKFIKKHKYVAKIRKKIRYFGKLHKKYENVAKLIKNYGNFAKIPKKFENFAKIHKKIKFLIHFGASPGRRPGRPPPPTATPLDYDIPVVHNFWCHPKNDSGHLFSPPIEDFLAPSLTYRPN